MNIKKIIKEEIQKVLKEGEFGTFDWPKYYLRNGELWDIDEKIYQYKGQHPPFNTIQDAEKWLEDNDERGNVIGFYDKPLNEEDDFMDIAREHDFKTVDKLLKQVEMLSQSKEITDKIKKGLDYIDEPSIKISFLEIILDIYNQCLYNK